ncbi:MAG: 4Fe-4S binding protein [Ignavibacteria bacterium]|nr:4Fe-4S binding protein [Ignavibacteria bacterium]
MIEKKRIEKNSEKPIQRYRFIIQLIFALICIWIGVEFSFFVKSLEVGDTNFISTRPAGVEAFLPISSLMSVYYFLLTGDIHAAHPAGFFIFLAIVGVSFVVGKSFCSWICPIGLLSEVVGDFGEKFYKKIFKRRVKLPGYLDYPLRSLKYLLLAFFVYSIFFSMTTAALKYFLDSSYNKISDIKMYYFFAEISQFSLIVISILFFLSIYIRYFWCRYLCPYGALLGLISFLSPTKIKRNVSKCVDCALCAKACPSFIKVDKVVTVRSDECTSCYNCIDVCPVANTLDVNTKVVEKKVSKKSLIFVIVLIYVGITSIGIFTGNWQSNISSQEYIELHQNRNSFGHPRSSSEIEELNNISEPGE